MKKRYSVSKLVGVAMLSSVAYVLMLLNFPIPPFPSFLMIDFSEVPALLAAIIFGPMAGVLVEFFKNVLDYFFTGSATGVPVGHASNFVAGLLFVLPTTWLYNKLKSKKGLTAGLIVATFVMAISMSLLNYYVFLPAYTLFLGADAMTSEAMKTMVIQFILPFNIIKGLIVTTMFMFIFRSLGTWISKQQLKYSV